MARIKTNQLRHTKREPLKAMEQKGRERERWKHKALLERENRKKKLKQRYCSVRERERERERNWEREGEIEREREREKRAKKKKKKTHKIQKESASPTPFILPNLSSDDPHVIGTSILPATIQYSVLHSLLRNQSLIETFQSFNQRRPYDEAVRSVYGRLSVRSVAWMDCVGTWYRSWRSVSLHCIPTSLLTSTDFRFDSSVLVVCWWCFFVCLFDFLFSDNVEPVWPLGSRERESYPERPEEADCIYYLRTGFCGYGSRCRFNHPRERSAVFLSILFCLTELV